LINYDPGIQYEPDLFMQKFALDPTWVKNHACYDELRTYGAIAA
jgi:hypothetical protein